MSDGVLTIVFALMMVTGLVGVLVPVLPGLVFMFSVALVYGFLIGFGIAGIAAISVIGVLTMAGVAVGFILPKRAADSAGTARRSQILGAVGAVIGFFVIPVVGLPIGALLGLLLGEYLDKGDVGVAWAATIELAKGFGLSALVQFGLGFVILLTWSAWALATVVG